MGEGSLRKLVRERFMTIFGLLFQVAVFVSIVVVITFPIIAVVELFLKWRNGRRWAIK